MYKALARDSVIYTLATVLSRGLQIILIPIYTRWLTPSDYGISDILNAVAAFSTIILSLEIIQAIARFYPVQRDPAAKREISSTGLLFISVNYALFAVIVMILAPWLAKVFFGAGGSPTVVRIAVLAMVCNGVYDYLQSQLRWDMRSLDYSVASIVYVLSSASASILFIVGLKLGVVGFFGGQIVGAIIAGMLSFFRNRAMYQFRISLPKLKEMLAFSSPFIFSSVCVILSTYVDRFFIKHFCDLPSVGVYGIAVRLSSVVGLLFVGFNIALTPMIYSNADDPKLPKDLARLFAGVLPIAALVAAGAFLFTKEILVIFTTPDYYGAAMVAPLLVCGAILANLYLFFPGMSIKKETLPIIFIGMITMVASLGTNALFVPSMGIAGAGLAKMLTGLVSAFSYYLCSQRRFPIPFKLMPVLGSIAIVALGAGASRLIELFSIPLPAKISIKAAMIVAGGVFVLRKNEFIMKLLVQLKSRRKEPRS